jgi:alpha-tubulin suppressor-like RCC1 family protein
MATNSISISSIYTGTNFIVAINDLNQVFAWGENNTGQLGNGTFTSSNIPMQTPGLPSIKSCATSESSTMALATDGSVYVWGGNTDGELGIGSTSVVNFPLEHPSLNGIDSIVAGLNHFLILKNDSTVWSVGNNDYGQLGIGSNSNSYTPTLIASISNIVHIGAGEQHSFAIDSSGMIYVWGNNSSGQLGAGDLNNRLSPESINLTTIVAIEGGATHSLFLNEKGEVYSCGDSSFGQLGNNSSGISLAPDKIEISGVNQISAGKYTSLFKRIDNSVFGCGRNLENQIFIGPLSEYSTPTHLNHVHGVGYIEASAAGSHFIYTESNSCISNILSLNVLNVPDAIISLNSDTLEASLGDIYQWYLDGNIIPNANEQTYVPLVSGNYSVEVGLNNGCSSLSESYTIGINSISDFTSNQILVYPNPAHNVLFIRNNSAYQNLEIVIRDQIGKTVYQSKSSIQEVLSIDLENLKTGNYYISILSDAQFSNYRFTKIN